MLKKILLLLVPVIAFVGGTLGGTILKPPAAVSDTEQEVEKTKDAEAQGSGTHAADDKSTKDKEGGEAAWFKFPNQFFIPLMRNGQVSETMILSLAIEMPAEATERIQAQEYRLRDALLRALMIHANTGGFEGNFTTDVQMNELRSRLVAAAKDAAGDDITNILIEDIARQ